MQNALDELIAMLDALSKRVESNEQRPSAEQICGVLAVCIERAKSLQPAGDPAREPYKMDSPTIDKIDAAINAGQRIVIETDGSVTVYPEGTVIPPLADDPLILSPSDAGAGDSAPAQEPEQPTDQSVVDEP